MYTSIFWHVQDHHKEIHEMKPHTDLQWNLLCTIIRLLYVKGAFDKEELYAAWSSVSGKEPDVSLLNIIIGEKNEEN